jgi:hypothetical protein
MLRFPDPPPRIFKNSERLKNSDRGACNPEKKANQEINKFVNICSDPGAYNNGNKRICHK